MKRDWICRVGALLSAALFLIFWIMDPEFSKDPAEQFLCKSVISRLFGSIVFLFALIYLRFHVFRKPVRGWWQAFLPAVAVVVNNLPILALLNGNVRVERTDLILLFALDAILIGTFEELAFRGVLFPMLLEKYGTGKKGVILTTVVSSALFGLVHLVNLLEGAGAGATILQVGYSFLIGAMCAVVLLKTGNLAFCILLHAVYDFCGGLIPTLGSGALWDAPTVIFTAVLGVTVAGWMLYLLFHFQPEEIRNFYQNKGEDHS